MNDTLTAAELNGLGQLLDGDAEFITVHRVTFRALIALARKGLECDADHTTYLRVLAGMAGERDALQAFKDWVHAYLDSKGVPHHPHGVHVIHGPEGYRIANRMDWVWARIAKLEAELAELRAKTAATFDQLASWHEPTTEGKS